MQNSEIFALQRSGLNDFLFAAVGIEPNGMTLSLASVFARLGDDPWREAGLLARLPRAEAITSLARTIATMPTSAWALPDATAIATRLIALLPARPRGVQPRPSVQQRGLDVVHLIRIALVLAAVAFGAIYLLGPFSTAPVQSFGAGHDSTAIIIPHGPSVTPFATHGAAAD